MQRSLRAVTRSCWLFFLPGQTHSAPSDILQELGGDLARSTSSYWS